MNKLTTDGDRMDRVRSRLEVLPPSAAPQQSAPHLEPVADSPPELESASSVSSPAPNQKRKKKKRKVRLAKEDARQPQASLDAAVPVVPVQPSAMADTVEGISVAESETSEDIRVRKPLPLASPVREDEQQLDLVQAELVEPELLPEKSSTLTDNQLSSDEQLEAINHWHTAVEAEPITLLDRVSRFMSGWATSFVFHMLLLIALALLTFGNPNRGGVLLSLDSVDSETIDSETVEVQVDFEAVLDSATDELDDQINEDLSEDDFNEMLEADEIEENLADFGFDSLAGEGVANKLGRGGDQSADASGQKGVAGESVDFFGAYAKGHRFIFVIDCSGSMSGERWRRAKYELNRSINGLGKDQQFCVILYNSDTRVMMNSRMVQLVKANEENKEELKKWLGRQVPDGGTYPRRAMTMALAQNPDAIFLLSDGEIQDNTYEFLLATNKPEAGKDGEYRKIPVHTIALLSTFGQRLLKAIADDNEGTFTRVGRR